MGRGVEIRTEAAQEQEQHYKLLKQNSKFLHKSPTSQY